MYGPTETTVWSTCDQLTESEGPLLIGRPIANTRVYILDTHGQPVPVGVPGELYIGGTGVTRGYLNRPELTAERFVTDPFSQDPAARLYRTGDSVRYHSDGRIEYLNRLDNQVKVRGFRIELGEIESVLGEHPAVNQGVVIVREDRPGDKRLAAYYVPQSGVDATVTELRKHLRGKLPEYMIPQHFVELPALPTTPNGKLDRKALPAPFHVGTEEQSYEAPRTEMETRLAKIWQEVIGIDRVGIHDNFFEIGGHSLLAVQVVARVKEAVGIELTLRSIVLGNLEQIADQLQQVLSQNQENTSDDRLHSKPFAQKLFTKIKNTLRGD